MSSLYRRTMNTLVGSGQANLYTVNQSIKTPTLANITNIKNSLPRNILLL